jgi:SAM-dependent methyltransferase
MCCPLCKSSRITQQDTLDTGLLAKLYKQKLGITITSRIDNLELFLCDQCQLKFFAPPWIGDESFYEQLQKYEFYYLSDKEEYDIAKKYVQPEDHVLEIGSGRGAFKSKLDCTSYVGLEFSTSAIAEARRNNIEILKESISDHARRNPKKYDVVCSFQVLEHVNDVSDFLGSAISCLKPKGRLIISVPNENSFMGREVNNVLNMPPHHVTRWSIACLRGIPRFFQVSLVDVEQDKLAEMHIYAYANSAIIHGFRKLFRLRPRILSRFLSSLFPRLILKALSFLIAQRIMRIRSRLPGHSVTAIYVLNTDSSQ